MSELETLIQWFPNYDSSVHPSSSNRPEVFHHWNWIVGRILRNV